MKPHNIMNIITKKRFAIFAGLSLALIAALLGTVFANDERDNPFKTEVTGQSDWSIIPAAFTPQFLFNGTDGDIYIRHLRSRERRSNSSLPRSARATPTLTTSRAFSSTFPGIRPTRRNLSPNQAPIATTNKQEQGRT
jgi:hypothetical protein